MEETGEKKGYYGKRPLWQWILIYIVIGAIVYGILYYVIWGRNGGYSSPKTNSNTPTITHTPPTSSTNIIEQKTGTQGTYLTDAAGLTLYMSTADSSKISNCTDSCAQTWPPYKATSLSGSLPTNIAIITRSDGSKQYTYKDAPLYYYVGDAKAGDTNGDGLGTFKLVTP